jgi:hypothetical protein
VVHWYPKERSPPLTSLVENPDAAVEEGGAVDGGGVLRLQQARREKQVGGAWVLVHEAVVPLGNRESPKQEKQFWIEKGKSARRWHPWLRNRVAIQPD